MMLKNASNQRGANSATLHRLRALVAWKGTGGPDVVCDLHTVRDSIALRFEPFKRMYENRSKIALNSTCSKGLKKRSLP